MASITSSAPSFTGTTLTESEGWTIHTLHEIGSTNSAAAHLPAWNAVRADVQTEGRGRTGRAWVSDEGGLWLSAVLPTPGPVTKWAILPLAAGWAVIKALESLGAKNLRLRWPNDIMVGRRKLAGLLLERFGADTAVVGLGLNVFNHPGAIQPLLVGEVITLTELLPEAGSLVELAALILHALRDVQGLLLENGFVDIVSEINARWISAAPVEVTLNGSPTPVRGRFCGLDSNGRLYLTTIEGVSQAYAPHEVSLMRELS